MFAFLSFDDISYHFGDKLIIDKIANNEQAIKRFVRTMKMEKGAVPHFILEPTGHYSQTLYRTLRDMKVRFTQLNPRLSRQFAGFTGVMEKTDKKDAQVLEDYGRLFHMKVTFLAIITPNRANALANMTLHNVIMQAVYINNNKHGQHDTF